MKLIRIKHFGTTYEFDANYLEGKSIEKMEKELKHVPAHILEQALFLVNGKAKKEKEVKKTTKKK